MDIFAKEQGISMYELLDRLLPDFGFDGLYKCIEVEGEEYRVFLGKDFKFYYVNEENKSRKSLPSKESKALKEEIKESQKELKEANKSQKERLEEYMIIQRSWSVEEWEIFYLTNPLMFIYASTLLWGVYDKDKHLMQLFYVDEDSSLLDIKEDKIDLYEGVYIRIVHALNLNEANKTVWQELFYDKEITQPFSQLDRVVYQISQEEKTETKLKRYTGKKPKKSGSSIKSLLECRGWEKEIVDSGSIEFYKEYPSENICIYLGVMGINITYDGSDYTEIYDTSFRRIKHCHQQVSMQELPEILFSELIGDMEMVMR